MPRNPNCKDWKRRFWTKVQKTHSCWIWIGASGGDRGRAGFRDEKGRFQNAARVSWRIHNGPIPYGKCVLHRCDNGMCVRPSHLFLGTRGDNNRDRDLKGRTAKGTDFPQAKLTENQVKTIKRMKNKCTRTEIAERFGVGRTTIFDIWNEKNWRHVSA
jgi:hypothetical protein